MQLTSDSIWFATLSEAEGRELCDVSNQAPLSAPDLLVLGSGIIGLATAYFAAERGLKVQVVTTDARLGTDAELSLGLIDPNVCRWQFSPATQQLAQSSRDWWARLAVRPEFQIDWRVTGALMVDAARLAPHPRQHMLAALEEGYSVHDVDAEQVALLEPQLSPLPIGGLHYPSEAVLHPLKAVVGFVKGFLRHGGRISRVAAITQLEINDGRLLRWQTSAGSIQPRSVVIDDSRWFGDESATSVVCEQSTHLFVATTALPPILKRPVLDAHWIVQLKTGEVAIEAPLTSNPVTARMQAVSRTRQLIPALRDADFTKSWTGLRQTSHDRLPKFGKVGAVQNVWSYGCFGCSQVLFAPIVGKTVADGIS